MRFKSKTDWASWIIFISLCLSLIFSINSWTWHSTLMISMLFVNLILLIFFSYNGSCILEDDMLIIQSSFRKHKIPYKDSLFTRATWKQAQFTFSGKKRLHISLVTGKKHPHNLNPKEPEEFFEELKKRLKEGQYALQGHA